MQWGKQVCNSKLTFSGTRFSRGCSINTFVIDSLIRSSFCSESSRHCLCQTIRARELIFKKKCSPPTLCHMSCVTRHMSNVPCQKSHVTCHVSQSFFFYQQGLLRRLVFTPLCKNFLPNQKSNKFKAELTTYLPSSSTKYVRIYYQLLMNEVTFNNDFFGHNS